MTFRFIWDVLPLSYRRLVVGRPLGGYKELFSLLMRALIMHNCYILANFNFNLKRPVGHKLLNLIPLNWRMWLPLLISLRHVTCVLYIYHPVSLL